MPKNDGKMTHTEQRYARQRVEGMLFDAKAAVREKHTTPRYIPSNKDIWDLIVSGKAKLDRKRDLKRRSHGSDPYFLPTLEEAFSIRKFERPEKRNDKAIDKACDALEAAATKAIDEIMLGDGSKAMKALDAFAEAVKKII